MNSRLEVALDFLKNGKSFSVGDLRLSIDGTDCLIVTGWSQYSNFVSLTKKNSIKELEEIKLIFLEMLSSSIDMKIFAQKKCIKYVLSFDDYGKASINICSEKNGIFTWELELMS